jgi:Hemerythrin HHE cation binding domain
VHAIKVLKEDHVRIETLLEEVAGSKENGQEAKEALFGRLDRELIVHTLAEENIFLPHVEDAIEDSKKATAEFFDENADVFNEAAELISQSYRNNLEIKGLLEDMRGLGVGDGGWEDKSGELRRVVELQIEREEELFPKAEKVLEEEDFERIGDLVEHCKWQVRGLAQAKLASSSSFRPALEEREVSLLFERDLQGSKRE